MHPKKDIASPKIAKSYLEAFYIQKHYIINQKVCNLIINSGCTKNIITLVS